MTRHLSEKAAKTFQPGADHYTAFVGPPREYDFMGATQFALLFALGLRESDRLLDFGCGSLRAGRLLIPFLEGGNYFGIEPNGWLIEEALDRQLGRGILQVKRPTFSNSDSFSADVFGEHFDFIVAQSIFSHAGPDLAGRALGSFKATLRPRGLCAVTFVHADQGTPMGWHYPETIFYRSDLVRSLLADANLVGVPIPWFHPRQTWWILSHEAGALPNDEQIKLLRGTTLRSPGR